MSVIHFIGCICLNDLRNVWCAIPFDAGVDGSLHVAMWSDVAWLYMLNLFDD